MARQYLFTFSIVVIFLPTVNFAGEFIVGDEARWTSTYGYEVFKYTIELHNMYQVNEDAYKNCIIPQDGVLASGEDTITLESPGPKYFVCGVGLHCEKGGQKLLINVKQRDTQGPIQDAKTPSKSLVVAPSQSPATNALPNALPSQFSNTNGPPYAQPIGTIFCVNVKKGFKIKDLLYVLVTWPFICRRNAIDIKRLNPFF
ncbi:early nodulin-55-1-like [Camellia sinensis]|uniref:early nodulin-55-1-like n=1 Tax=Camellia sinensis TaxID=4442 RepID=UPI001036A41F|nr:early nodulin-55-1-like [Camellia sinensis]